MRRRSRSVSYAKKPTTQDLATLSNQLTSMSLSDDYLIMQENDETKIVLNHIQPDEYTEFLLNTLEMGRFPGPLKKSTSDMEASSHALCAVNLFSAFRQTKKWLSAKIQYDNEKQVVTLMFKTAQIMPSSKDSDVKLTYTDPFNYVLENIRSYYADRDDDLDLSVFSTTETGNNELLLDTSLHHESSSSSASTTSDTRYRSTSSDSDEQYGVVGTAERPSISTEVIGDYSIKIAIGGERPNTQYGRVQADHISAYALFIRTILSSVGGIPTTEIPNLLMAGAQYFLSDTDHAALQKIAERHQAEAHSNNVANREERKAITKKMRHKKFLEQEVAIVKNGLKTSYAWFLARLINELATEIIQRVNLDDQATFLALSGKKDRSSLGQEGARVKKALQALHALDLVLASEKMDPSTPHGTKQVNKISIASIKQGLKHYKSKEIKQYLKKLLDLEATSTSILSAGIFKINNASKLPTLSSWSKDLVNEVVQFIVDLFDFDYEQQMVNAMLHYIKQRKGDTPDLSTAMAFIATKSTKHVLLAIKHAAGIEQSNQEKKLIKESDYQEITSLVNTLLSFLDLKNKNYQLLTILEETLEPEIIETFQQVSTRHFGFVLAAFKHLGKVNQDSLTLLAKTYVVQLIEQEKWNNLLSMKPKTFLEDVNVKIDKKLYDITSQQSQLDTSKLQM